MEQMPTLTYLVQSCQLLRANLERSTIPMTGMSVPARHFFVSLYPHRPVLRLAAGERSSMVDPL